MHLSRFYAKRNDFFWNNDWTMVKSEGKDTERGINNE
ncbi:hypothetical protein N784_11995 [Pontibacillus litoralis JSM 072002]|uniref:Uncharacterized protein n=1 Tax=Pontibacillus litoralis JSM 072002 TaxID=1385512 RepID=A0A0A5G0T5_9BACI|nr:hypothetical protein N784_11995 [Pontibacillus litoralis JSM 072002]